MEIELKNGRIIHARPAGSGGCAILPGPARYEPRRWRDLTPDLPFAFARDAVVTLAEAVELDHKVVGLRLKFANGAQFVYDTSGGGPRLTTSIDEVSGARS
ncbi:MAG: hypothetical protein GWM88_03155 [Pseudomonadales bacterium]|nr:hypothetical protein [Pseudomonadales bacterium]NIX07068.1 hypothetical protein [Pseudomonadales bacterium]